MMTMVTRERTRVTKVLVAGSGAVGKTTLVKVLKFGQGMDESQTDQKYNRTPFLELETIPVAKWEGSGSGSPGSILMVDVAGQLALPLHALRDLTSIALDHLSLVLLVFSADNMQSLIDLKDWMELVKSHFKDRTNETPQFVLLMNKCDLPPVMDRALIEHIRSADPSIIAYFETSCKTGMGISELTVWLAKRMSVNDQGRNI